MVNCYYFSHRLGAGYVVGIGGFEIAKFWFGDDEEEKSSSPLSFEDCKRKAEELVDYLNENKPITPEMVEEYGDSDEAIKYINIMDKLSNDEELTSKEKANAMEIMFDKILGDCCCGD